MGQEDIERMTTWCQARRPIRVSGLGFRVQGLGFRALKGLTPKL